MNKLKSINPCDFDDFAPAYEQALQKGLKLSGENPDFFADGRLAWLRRVLLNSGNKPGHILDFGCGVGAATPFLRQAFPLAILTGCDPSEQSLAKARLTHTSHSAEFVSMSDAARTSHYDLVFCNGVFHHIPPEKRQVSLNYIYACLKPGGYFALFENNPWNPGTRLVMSRIPFDRDAITISPPESKILLRSAGFTVDTQQFLFFFPKLLAFLRPLERWLLGVPLGAQFVTLARK